MKDLRNVLIVEDEPDWVNILETDLARLGYPFVVARDLTELWRQYAGCASQQLWLTSDLILMTIRMLTA